jgi:hypothetical protein
MLNGRRHSRTAKLAGIKKVRGPLPRVKKCPGTVVWIYERYERGSESPKSDESSVKMPLVMDLDIIVVYKAGSTPKLPEDRDIRR